MLVMPNNTIIGDKHIEFVPSGLFPDTISIRVKHKTGDTFTHPITVALTDIHSHSMTIVKFEDYYSIEWEDDERAESGYPASEDEYDKFIEFMELPEFKQFISDSIRLYEISLVISL